MKRHLSLLYLACPTSVLALVPHRFWNRPSTKATASSKSEQRRSPIDASFLMYFDDCERSKEVEERLKNPLLASKNIFSRCNSLNNDENDFWIISQSDEKQRALDRFLGYNPKSAGMLTDEQVEEETLRWVVDTDIVWSEDEDASPSDSNTDDIPRRMERQRVTNVQYDGINDLFVASSCHSTAETLAFLWNRIVEALEEETSTSPKSSSSRNSAKLIVFPKSESIWNYDTMVTILEAIQMTRPLLPSNIEFRLDLFHPNFKHSPRMWSPQWHSPFPTVGITIKTKKQVSIDELDLDSVRGKLDVIFQSVDATREHIQNSHEDHQQILKDSRSWFDAENEQPESAKNNEIDWVLHPFGSPFQLYRTLWNLVLDLSTGDKNEYVVIDPFLDSHTFHRVAVTVNAALIRLDIPVRITEVYHPFARSPCSNSSCKTRPPYGMIQLSPLRQ